MDLTMNSSRTLVSVSTSLSTYSSTSTLDIVYVGLLNHQHKAVVLKALENGKHCLCEKPLGLNAKEVREMVEAARERKLFLMEVGHTKNLYTYACFRDTGVGSSLLGSISAPVSSRSGSRCLYKPTWVTIPM